MVKKLLSAAAVVMLALSSFAAQPNINLETLKERAATVNSTAKQIATEAPSTSSDYQAPDPGTLKPSFRKSLGQSAQPLSFVDAPVLNSDQILGVAKEGMATSSKAPRKIKRSEGGTPKLKLGVLFQEDVNVSDAYYTARLTLSETPETGVYQLTNVYNWGDTIQVKINSTTGEVSIPQQKIYTHSTYGECSIIPIDIREDGYYLVQGDLKGNLSSDGVISLGTYAIAVTQKDVDDSGNVVPGKYFGSLFNIFKKSEWKPANAEVASYNVSQDKMHNSEALVDQISENEVLLCGFTAIEGLSDPLLARITPDKRMLISPQKVYTNLLYGDFNNYPATFELDQSSGQWKVKIDSKSYMVLNDKGKGELSIDGYVIAGKSSPSQLIGYAFKDVKLFLDEDLVYPTPMALNFEGEGTAASPYLIKSVNDIKAMAQATQGGNSFEGVCFALANDIDMSSISPTSYITIGDALTPFNGQFDGKGFTISNFKADGKGFADTGLFGVIGAGAKVSNIKFNKAIVTSAGNDVGVVAGKSAGVITGISVTSSRVDCDGELGGGIVGETSGGSISDCYFSGAVYSCGSGAGISGESFDTEITNCVVDANIILDGALSTLYNKECAGIVGTILRGKLSKCYASGVLEDQKGYGYMGGLAGYASMTDISESFNTAIIFAKRASMGTSQNPDEGDNYCGGLVGYISESTLTNCYNSGTLMKSEPSKNVGGLVGYFGVRYVSSGSTPTEMQGVSPIVNCYNSGQVISYYDYPWKGVYGNSFTSTSYVGPTPEEKCVLNAYSDGQIIGLDYSYNLPTRELTSKLPKDFDPAVWTITPGNYPVLKNVGTGSQAQELSAKPLTLRAIDNSNKVKVEFDVAPSSNVGWALSFDKDAGETATETKALRMDGSKVYVKDQYSNSIVMASSANGWGVKAYKLAVVPKLFEGEGTADDPYLMKTVADYKNLHNAVASYSQTHLGDYFAMANDIDFEQTPEFSGVGYGTTNYFRGTFDGKGKTVHNLKIDAVAVGDDGKYVINNCVAYTGLFSLIGEGGKVCNVNMAADCSILNFTYGGSIAGANLGTIENCRNYADIKGITSYIGGIVGINAVGGKVLNCYNSGEVTLGTSYGGGIAGYSRENALISNCQNDGVVINKYHNPANATVHTNCLGGIAGYNASPIENCVNTAAVTAFYAVGGISGSITNFYNEGALVNCVNTGLVTNLEATLERGGLVGKINGLCRYENNIYDGSINVNGAIANGGSPGAISMCTGDLVSGNAIEGLDASLFDFKADAYPVLKQFANEDASKALRVMYVGFAKKQMRTNVLTDVPLSKAEGLNFKLGAMKESNFSIADNMLKVKKPEGNVVASDTIFATLNKYEKSFVLNAVPKILDGDGDKESPYLIATPADWNKLADFMDNSKWEYAGNYFKITNDLDFKGDSIRVVAVNGVNFQADLDGANHTIKGYVYSNVNSVKTKLVGPNIYIGKYLGIIGTLGNEGRVANITLDGDFKCHSYAASVVGDNYGLVENIINKGKVETLTDGYASGIVSRAYAGSVIRNCINEGEVISKKTYAQGIVYSANGTSVIENCVNKGKVSATTTGAYGIAYTVQGTIKGCHNEGALEANSTMAGIAGTLGLTACAEDCYNSADLKARTGGTIAGGFTTLTARKSTTEPIGGYVKGCYNTGNLSGTSGVYGLISAANAGWTIEDCYNTGDLTATTGYANGLIYQLKGTAAGSSDPEPVYGKLLRCYNTGNIHANGAGSAGLINDASKMTYIADCYNLGNVDNLNTGLTTAGLVGKHNGIMERCFNAGNVTSAGNSVGGLVGYIASGDVEEAARISNCFNIGDIVSTYTGTNTNGNAGGLGGYLSTVNDANPHVIENCYNTGNVTANQRVAGLFAGAFRPRSIVKNCYNSGKITCLKTDSEGRYYWSGTTFSNNYQYITNGDTLFMLYGHENCFYDKTVNPTGQFRNVPNSAKTTDELRKLAISDAFVNPGHGGFPILKDFADHDASHAGSALILLSGDDSTHSLVKNAVTLVGPEGCEWAAYDVDADGNLSENVTTLMSIKDNQAIPNGKGNVALKCTYKGMSKHYFLTVEGTGSMVDETFAAKEIKGVEYINLNGQKVAQPEPGQVYLVRTIFVDGTMRVEKKIAR